MALREDGGNGELGRERRGRAGKGNSRIKKETEQERGKRRERVSLG